MSEKYHKIHIRMTGEQYARLKEKSNNAGMTMNKYLMQQLVTMKPFEYPPDEIAAVTDMTNEAGKRINEIARAFNSGYGRKEMLSEAIELLKPVHNKMHEIIKKKSAAEEVWAEETGFVMPARHKRHAVHKKEKKYLMIRLTEEQYMLLKEYRPKVRLNQNSFFRRLINGVPLDGNMIELFEACGRFEPVNKIGSNIRQISRNPIALKLDEERVRQLQWISSRLSKMVQEMERFGKLSAALGVIYGRAK